MLSGPGSHVALYLSRVLGKGTGAGEQELEDSGPVEEGAQPVSGDRQLQRQPGQGARAPADDPVGCTREPVSSVPGSPLGAQLIRL